MDCVLVVHDTDALNIVFDLLRDDGLCLGSSSGINVAGAIELGKKMGPNKIIVTILCDVGTRYASRLFNREFLKSKGLPCPDWIK